MNYLGKILSIVLILGVFGQVVLGGQPQPIESKSSGIPQIEVTVEEQKQVREALMDWAADLHRELARESETSFCFSPTSIAAVLGMIIEGMPQGAARESVLHAMNLSDIPAGRLHAILGSLLNIDPEAVTIDIANAVGVNGFVKETYLQRVQENYDAEVFPLGSDAAEQINSWVAEKTHDKITQMIPPQMDLSDLKAALMNAIYFKGQWEEPFNQSNSYSQPFACVDGKDVEKMMMHDNNFYAYFKGEGYSVLEKKFNGGVSLVAFLPDEPRGLRALEKELSAPFIQSCREQMRRQNVRVTLPKLDINFSAPNLLKTLQRMGFDFSEELTEIADKAAVSQIIHKACLKVDEEGAVGAAATVAVITTSSATPRPPVPIFDARHPFAYFIMAGDAILFQGTVSDESSLVDQ